MKSHQPGNRNPGPAFPLRIATRGPNLVLRVLRAAAYYLVAAFLVIWVLNILGESTIFNSPGIYYSGIDANTGKQVTVQGCRPERLRPDGSCNKTLDLDLVLKAFPRWSR